jgi:hypothetical protein
MKSLLGLLVLIFTFGCDVVNFENGNGDITSDKRGTDSFTTIQLIGNYEIGLKKGPKEQIVIVTDSNLLEYIDTETEGDVLIIENSKKIKSDAGVKIYITYQQLEGIKSVGASIIRSEAPIRSERLELEVPGATLIDLEIDVRDLDIVLAGAGSIRLKGKVESQSVALRGVGNLEAFDLESQSCQVEVSGMGGAEVYVKENLHARVNGVGSIKYQGDPLTVDDKVSGIGTIESVDTDEMDRQVESI